MITDCYLFGLPGCRPLPPLLHLVLPVTTYLGSPFDCYVYVPFSCTFGYRRYPRRLRGLLLQHTTRLCGFWLRLCAHALPPLRYRLPALRGCAFFHFAIPPVTWFVGYDTDCTTLHDAFLWLVTFAHARSPFTRTFYFDCLPVTFATCRCT